MQPVNLAVVAQANAIFTEYQAAGYILTLRQVYYQFVSRDLLPNSKQSYKRLGSILNDARLMGLVDWELMEDRTRSLKTHATWPNPTAIIGACADQFRIDKWAGQRYRPEVWIEKDALSGVFDRICEELQVPYFSCRGYTSQSEMWAAAQRLAEWEKTGQTPLILHFGDHDPSGVDMTRDITDRLNLFGASGVCRIDLRRLALNMDQIEQYNPPPNPAKITDSRARRYIEAHGDESWELDALQPDVLAALVRNEIEAIRDDEAWDAAVEVEEEHRRLLGEVSRQWAKITGKL